MTTRKKRWPVALEGFIANMLFGALFTWSIYRGPLLEIFPAWNEGMLSIVFAIHNVMTCLGILIGGRLAQKISLRKLFAAYAFMVLIGFGSFAILPESMPGFSYAIVIVCFAIIASFGTGMGVNIMQSATLPWYPQSAGTISGILFMALGASSFVFAAVSGTTLPLLGVKLSFASIGGALFIIAMIILAVDKRAVTVPDNAVKESTISEQGFTTREMLKTPSFWLLLVWCSCMSAAGFILLDHAAGIAVGFAASALIGMLISPANGLGSMGLGTLLDKLGLRRNLLFICLLMTFSVLLLIFGGIEKSATPIIFGLVISGFAYGGSRSTYSAAIERVYGGRFFSANLGVANISMAVGALISAFSGTVLDAYGGNYMSVFVMTAILMVPVLICGIALQKVELTRF